MDDAVLKGRVVQNFRAHVLKEAALRPGMDDAQLSALHSLVFYNNNDILRRLYQDTDYLKRVVARVATGPWDPERDRGDDDASLADDVRGLSGGAGDGGDDDDDSKTAEVDRDVRVADVRSERLLALRFLREMVGLSRNAQPQSRDALYRHLFFETDVYGALAVALSDCAAASRPLAAPTGYVATADAAAERACCVEVCATALRADR